MELIVIVAVVLVVLAVSALAIVATYLPWYSDQKQARDWVKCVENAEADRDIVACGALKISTNINQKPLANAKRQKAAEAKFTEAQTRLKTSELAGAHRNATEPADVAHLCLTVFKLRPRINAELVFGIPENRMGILFVEAMEKTLTGARRHNVAALDDYMRAINDSRLLEFCDTYGVSPPVYPSDWNDIVMEIIDYPPLYYFKNVRQLATADIEMPASRALIEKDLKMAKLLLAYCKEQQCEHNEAGDGRPTVDCDCKRDYPYRDAVGDHLWSELLLMIERTM